MCCEGGQYAGTIGRQMRHVRVSIAPDSAVAYAVNEVIEGGEKALECAVGKVERTGRIVELLAYETADSGSPIELPIRLIFLRSKQEPVDHATYAVPSPVTDILGVVDIAAPDWIAVDAEHSIARVHPDLSIEAETTTIWMVAVAQGAGTYAALANITIEARIHFD